MVATTAKGRAMMDNVYGYDKVNNILSLTNNAPIPVDDLMGGSSQYDYLLFAALLLPAFNHIAGKTNACNKQ